MKKYLSALICGTMIFASSAISVHGVNYIESYDVNHDNKVTSSDVAYISKILSGLAKPTSIDNLDVNGNGIVDEIDLRTVLYYLLGQKTTTVFE
ncbi:MAG: dockerin type I repeat-containing protein [Oscillospiraceae bacterium]|nr:dockerin type I repeat-containing protein [Oscillospiraceae bacterium]